MVTKLVTSPPRQHAALRAFLKAMLTGRNIRTRCVIIVGLQESIDGVSNMCADFVKRYSPLKAIQVMRSRTGHEREPICLWIDMRGFDFRTREGHDFICRVRASRMYLENIVLLASRLPEEVFDLADIVINIDMNREMYTITANDHERLGLKNRNEHS